MGGAAIAVVNDETAVLENPAGLGRLRNNILTLFDIEMQAQKSLLDFSLDGSILDAFSMQGVLDYLRHNRQATHKLRLQAFPSFVSTNFGSGLLIKQEHTSWLANSGALMHTQYQRDLGLAAGYSFRLFDGILKLGVRSILLWRSEVDGSFPTTSTDLSFESLSHDGLAISPAIGLILTSPYRYNNNIAIVWRDFMGTSFHAWDIFSENEKRPEPIPATIDTALSHNIIFSSKWRLQASIEYRDLLNVVPDAWKKKTHAGAEINYGDRLFFRGGLHQGHWTAGMELSEGKTQFQIATYGEEVGTPNVPKVDRRFVIKWSFRL